MKRNTSNQYFVSASLMDIMPAINGRYGLYARSGRVNWSAKKLFERGYELRTLTDAEVKTMMTEARARIEENERKAREAELARRAMQVELCLAGEPLKIGEGNHLWRAITHLTGKHLDAYVGCGKATAYIVDNEIIAWHYGDERPANAPKCDYVQLCEVSCAELLF